MKRITLLFAFAVLGIGAQAGQPAESTTPAASTTSAAPRADELPRCAGFVSNGFWDNWEVAGGIGTGVALSNGKDKGSHFGFEGNISATKWVHPILGLRLQLQGGRFSNSEKLPDSGALEKHKWPYIFLHVDYALDLTNWIGGYREERLCSAVPFVGFGYMASDITSKSEADNGKKRANYFAFSYGVLSKFRVCKAVDLNIEVKGLLVPASICPVELSGKYLTGLSITAGATYRFNGRGWKRVGK